MNDTASKAPDLAADVQAALVAARARSLAAKAEVEESALAWRLLELRALREHDLAGETSYAIETTALGARIVKTGGEDAKGACS